MLYTGGFLHQNSRRFAGPQSAQGARELRIVLVETLVANEDRFHSFSYDELLKRDKLSLDLFWLRDASLEGTDNLPHLANSRPASSRICKMR